ncbi:MAG: hypothetical protein K0S32_1205 [Bacteroidetes bacterium]|nr:hypothetical protein [Bacteroidota bacterium]
MKKILIPAFVILLASCAEKKDDGKVDSNDIKNSASADGKVTSDLPEMKFEEETYDFGKMTQGEKVSHAFIFKNTGSESLIISGASGSCGCTVPEWPKEPIRPGGEGKINVVFNSEGKSGAMEKTVTVITNCEPATKILRIKAEIIVPEVAR